MEPVTEAVMARPTPALHRFVDSYMGYFYDGFEPGIHRGLPSAEMTFIISLDDPVDMVSMPDRAQRAAPMTAFVGGLHAAPALIRHEGRQFGLTINMTPFGVRTMFGMPAGALAWTVVELDVLLGAAASELLERLHGASGWRARFAVLDDVLVRALHETVGPAPEVRRAWSCLVDSGGAIEIGALAKETGWSRRHLSERFRAEVGLSPKVTGRVLRFDRARRLLGRVDRPGLADVAATCGYYDQAHLTREWNELAGCTPTTWMSEELPSVQDSLVETGAC
jgi:AraC-like DNA-binding protein